MKKYIYIICYDGQIIEIEEKENILNTLFETMRTKSLLTLEDRGMILNGSDFKKVFNAEQYDSWVKSTKPAEYIKNGTWFDGKERQVLRHESWRQKEIDERLKLEAPTVPLISELNSAERKAWFEKYKPNFLKDKENLAKKMKLE